MKSPNQTGSAHAVIIVILVVGLLGTLGFVFWQNFINKPADNQANTAPATVVEQETQDGKCQSDDEAATNGIFCSEAYGVKFSVPDEFKGKLQQADNKPVYPVSYTEATPAAIGQTERVVSAEFTEGEYSYTLTVSLYPQIAGMTLGLAGGDEFVVGEKKLVSTASGEEYPEYPFVTTDNDTKIYRDTYGDVGYMLYSNAVVAGDKVIKIELKSSPRNTEGLPQALPTIDDEVLYKSVELL